MIGQTISHYRITGKLGAGGMGVVYQAEDETLHREVALKFLPAELVADPQARKRLLKEAQAASRLNHPDIATIYEVGESDGTPFIAMELVSGQSLKDVLQRGPLPPTQLLDVARQIAAGLHEAHQAGVLHRDVKPGNIMLDAKGRVKILDFGLAVSTGRERAPGEPEEIFITRTATTWTTGGTVPYMSPQQLRGEPSDARNDIFSYGVMLYECLTGRLPFQGETSIDILHAILRDEPVPVRKQLPDITPEWEQLVERCLAKSPEQRFRSMAEVLEALRRIESPPTRLEKSLAVLYFENLSGVQEDQYFRDGMTEDIITELLKIKGVQIFPRPTVLAYRDKPVTAQQVARELNAAFVLTGSIRRAGNRLRITAQLVDASTGFPLWSERYDRELKDVFEVQEEIARNIAQALRITLSPREEKAIGRKPTENTQAYDFYLRGRGYARRLTRQDLEFAMQMFRQATAADADFALAHAGLGYVCGLYYYWYQRDPQWIEKGLSACHRALELDPDSAEVLVARATMFEAQRKYDQAIEYARRALERQRDCEGAYLVLGRAWFASDRWQEAAAMADRAVEVSGDDYNVYIPYRNALECLGQHEHSRKLMERQSVVLRKQLELVPEDVRARILLASNHASLGEEEAATRELQLAVALRPNDANILYNAACVYGIMQKKAEGLAMLKKAKEVGFPNLDWAARDPDLTCLHGEPEFLRLLADDRKP